MLTDTEHFALFGTLSREDQGRRLGAGALEATLKDGNLATIRYLGHEVLRAIAFLVRDRDWGTCAPAISDLVIDEADDHFRLTYTAVFTAPTGACLTAATRIEGWADGRLDFVARCRADADFETARAGFTVLHPLAGIVGQPVDVLHSDGTLEHGRWPDRIEPWQPFKDIRAITHRAAPGLAVETRFAGDVFEMEDQRNWTDASYKTYVRPLALPWPYRLAAGEVFEQGVSLRLDVAATAAPAVIRSAALRLARQSTAVTLPTIGIGLRPECAASDAAALPLLATLPAGLLIGHFDPLAGHGVDDLAAYARLKRAAGRPLTLELALPCQQPFADELAALAADCRAAGLAPDSLFVCPSVDRQSTPPGSRWPDCPPLADVYTAARAAFPSARLGGGMMSYFTEINRKRVPAEGLDYISHTTNPIVHAADDLSVMRTFEALADVVRSVRAIYPDKPYRIGPSTIAMRQNPYGAATKDNPGGGRQPMANADPRHNGEFGAAWALAYAATVAPAGLEALTLSTLTGPFGLVAGPGEPAPAGALRPIAAVIAALAALAGQPCYRLAADHPGLVLGLGGATTTLIANLTPEAVPIRCDWRFDSVRSLGRRPVRPLSSDTLELQPYQSAVIV